MPEAERRRLMADQDVWASTVRFLREHGHDILTASEAGLSRAEDEELLRHAASLKRGLLTRDKGFGNLIFREGLPNSGLILLRTSPASASEAHRRLIQALAEQPALPQANAILVVEPHRYRIRRAPF